MEKSLKKIKQAPTILIENVFAQIYIYSNMPEFNTELKLLINSVTEFGINQSNSINIFKEFIKFLNSSTQQIYF